MFKAYSYLTIYLFEFFFSAIVVPLWTYRKSVRIPKIGRLTLNNTKTHTTDSDVAQIQKKKIFNNIYIFPN